MGFLELFLGMAEVVWFPLILAFSSTAKAGINEDLLLASSHWS
jgi:hypothetical protein